MFHAVYPFIVVSTTTTLMMTDLINDHWKVLVALAAIAAMWGDLRRGVKETSKLTEENKKRLIEVDQRLDKIDRSGCDFARHHLGERDGD